MLGARTSESLLFDEELAPFAEVVVCTDDGSAGRAGFVTDALRDLLATRSVDVVYAAGPVPMMRAVVGRHPTARRADDRVPQPDHGRRHGHVRRVSGDGRRNDALRLRRRSRVRRTRRRLRRVVRSAHHVRRIRARRPSSHVMPGGGVRRRAQLSKRERLAIDRQEMPTRDAHERSGTFDEVNLGFTERLAMLEAQRCLACKRATCVEGCPVMVDIPTFLRRIEEGDLAGAARVLFADNALPAVTGRVCPQEHQCEAECVRGRKGAPVAIGHLERFVADWARGHVHEEPPASERSGKTRRHRRGRPRGPDRGGRAGPARSRRHDLRSPARARWRAVVRHPGVPAAQRDRGARGAPPRSPRRPHRVQCGDRPHLHARRPAQTASMPCSSRSARGCRCSSASPAKG